MPKCRVIRTNGDTCHMPSCHKHKGHNICEKHWNNGCLANSADDVEARRRLTALHEMPAICEVVLKAVIANLNMGYNQMAEMVHRLGLIEGHLTRAEAHEVSLLVVNTVKLNRRSTKATEHVALRALGEMIQDLCA